MSNVGSMFHIYFQSGPARSSFDIDELPMEQARQAFLMHTLNLGVLISEGNRYYLSAAHSSAVVDRMIDVFQESLALVREDGLFSKYRPDRFLERLSQSQKSLVVKCLFRHQG